jgi:hypothetical protein
MGKLIQYPPTCIESRGGLCAMAKETENVGVKAEVPVVTRAHRL